MTQQVSINPEIVAWAQARAGLDESSLAKKMGVQPDRLQKWKKGQEPMTFGQIRKLAEKTYTPLGYLFAEEPHEETLPIPDFRTFGDHEHSGAKFSVNLLDTIYSMQHRQNWFRDYLIETGADPLPFVTGHSAQRENDADVVESIRDFLQVKTDEGIAEHSPNKDVAIRELIKLTEEKTGILIVRNGIVGNNTSRPLDVKEFRGFALYDEYAPLIFINGKDASAAQIFTLVHELVHLWLGEGGVSNLDVKTLDKANHIEKFCNRVAAELLVPLKTFLQYWKRGIASGQHIRAIGKKFNVSNLVIARRTLDNNLISQNWYWDFYNDEQERSHKTSQHQDAVEGGGNFYATYFHRANRRFAAAVIVSALEGRLSYRDAHSLLGIKKTKTFNEIASKLGY